MTLASAASSDDDTSDVNYILDEHNCHQLQSAVIDCRLCSPLLRCCGGRVQKINIEANVGNLPRRLALQRHTCFDGCRCALAISSQLDGPQSV